MSIIWKEQSLRRRTLYNENFIAHTFLWLRRPLGATFSTPRTFEARAAVEFKICYLPLS